MEKKTEKIIQKKFEVDPEGRLSLGEAPISAERRWKQIFVPGGVVLASEPTFSGHAFIRYTKEGGEDFPWLVTKRKEGALWYGGTAEGWVAEKLGRKKGKSRMFYGALRQEIEGVIPEKEQ